MAKKAKTTTKKEVKKAPVKPAVKPVEKPAEEYYLVAGYGKIAATSQEEAEKKVAELIAKGI